jgi:hypothetical protein
VLPPAVEEQVPKFERENQQRAIASSKINRAPRPSRSEARDSPNDDFLLKIVLEVNYDMGSPTQSSCSIHRFCGAQRSSSASKQVAGWLAGGFATLADGRAFYLAIDHALAFDGYINRGGLGICMPAPRRRRWTPRGLVSVGAGFEVTKMTQRDGFELDSI